MLDKTHASATPEQLAAVKQYRTIEALIPAHWTEGDVQANGIRQHYYRSGGTKPVLVLLHGFQESALCWLPVARVLEQDYDLVLWSMPEDMDAQIASMVPIRLKY